MNPVLNLPLYVAMAYFVFMLGYELSWLFDQLFEKNDPNGDTR